MKEDSATGIVVIVQKVWQTPAEGLFLVKVLLEELLAPLCPSKMF
jgi:hypothetical protein